MNSATSWRSIACALRGEALRGVTIVALTFTALAQVHAPRSKAVASKPPNELAMQSARLNNLGVAYMNQQKADKALRFFEQAHSLQPKFFSANLNRGIALLNLQRFKPAEAILLEAVRLRPASARAWYNLGILYRSQGRLQPAVDAFEQAAKIDKDDPDTQYFLGFLFTQLQKYPEAVEAFQNALRLNPFHASSEFGLAKALQRQGDSSGAREHVTRFQHLVQAKLAAPISLVYGEQGKYSLAEQSAGVSLVPPAIPVHFVSVAAESGLTPANPGSSAHQAEAGPAAKLITEFGPGACMFDIENDGLLDVYIAAQDAQRPAALYRNLGKGHFENVTDASGLPSSVPGLGCSAGDYDNDGLTDLAIADAAGVHVFHNQGKGKFKEVTAQLGIKNQGIPAGVNFVDYDHDGDLDLYVTHIADAPISSDKQTLNSTVHLSNSLWRDNGNGTFTDVTAETGLGGNGSSLGAVATDFNNDRAVDFVVTGIGAKPLILLNPREGTFRVSDPWQTEVPIPSAGVVAFDFNKDGWMDLALTHPAAPGLTLWRNVEGNKLERVALPKLNWIRAFGLAALDYDNDGWLDIAAVGETEQGCEIHLFRNRGPRGFEDVTHATGLDKIKLKHPRALVAADFDQDGDADLLITQNGGDPVLLRNDGGNRNAWIRLALRGLNDNKSAVGTKVEVYAGTVQQKWEAVSSSGYLSQSSPEVLAGLGSATQSDVVRMLWPTGVVQDEVELPVRRRQSITEIDRRVSSCPVLFAWNGREFEFISDVIGPAVIGHWVAPGQTNFPDPDEYIKVEGSRLQPRNGRLSFRFGEPMEEVNYLDQVRLLAVDHPSDLEIYPNERFLSSPPFPEFKIIPSQNARAPASARDDRGRNLLPELLQRDRKYVTGFDLLPFAGFAKMHTLELDLDPIDPRRPLRLLMHGFTEYFSANSMYAAYQAGISPIPPYVEALDSQGRWVRILDDMGFPAGLPRTIVVDLSGKLPADSHRIRITTNLQVYWDQILVDDTPTGQPLRVEEIPLQNARLRFHGYPRQIQERATTDLTYHYNEVSQTGPFVHHSGAYTRYGDVKPLLQRSDDQFVIFGSGDEVALDFDAKSLPKLPTGWSRDYLFFADGFVKDMDFYESDPLTVDALPFHSMPAYPYPEKAHYPDNKNFLDYLLNYNTRFYSGNSERSFRFNYANQGPD